MVWPSMKTAPTASSLEAWFAGGVRLSTAKLVNEGLACGSSEEHAHDVYVDDVK
jgi:hypothetical protein